MRHLSLAPTSVPQARPLEFVEAAIASGCDSAGLRLHRSPALPFHPVAGNRELIDTMRQQLADHGIGVLDIFTFYLQPACDFDAFERALELGAAFGARYALVQADDADPARLVDTFGRFCDLAAQHELGVMLEFNPARPVATLAQSVALIERCARGNAGICVDPLHLARSGGTPSDVRSVASSRLPYAQWSDGTIEPVRRLLSGQGTLPLVPLLAALSENLPLSVEVPMPQGEDASAARWCATVIDHTRQWLAANEDAIRALRPRI